MRRFKGLERTVVIFVASGDEMDSRELAYVALSRARAHLGAIASEAHAKWLREGMADS
ncbi:MAG: ATP-binding domain-containing protein [Sandaracinobacter sp.]